MVCRARLSCRSPDRLEPVTGVLPRRSWDRTDPGQGRERRLGAQPAGMRPADQHLSGADGSHTRQLGQPRGSSVDERGDLGVELVGFGLEQPDALPRWPVGRGRSPDAQATWPAGCGGWRRSGSAWPSVGRAARRAAPQVPHDQRLGGWLVASTRAATAPRRVTSSTRSASRCPRCRGAASRSGASAWLAARTASAASVLAPVRLAGRLGRQPSTTHSSCSEQAAGQPSPVAASTLDRPAAPARDLDVGDVARGPVALGVGPGLGLSGEPADGRDRCSGQGVAVGVDPGDASTRSASMAMRLLLAEAAVVGAGLGASHRAAQL
jgi:hypothetical protein